MHSKLSRYRGMENDSDEMARFEDIILVPSAVYKFISLDIDILAHSRICFLEIVQGFCFYD